MKKRIYVFVIMSFLSGFNSLSAQRVFPVCGTQVPKENAPAAQQFSNQKSTVKPTAVISNNDSEVRLTWEIIFNTICRINIIKAGADRTGTAVYIKK